MDSLKPNQNNYSMAGGVEATLTGGMQVMPDDDYYPGSGRSNNNNNNKPAKHNNDLMMG